MFCVLEFVGEKGKLLSVVPTSWFDGKMVTYKNSKTAARAGRIPTDKWCKYPAEMRTGQTYCDYDEAEDALERYVSQMESSESEKELTKRVSTKVKRSEYEYSDNDDADLENSSGTIFLQPACSRLIKIMSIYRNDFHPDEADEKPELQQVKTEGI